MHTRVDDLLEVGGNTLHDGGLEGIRRESARVFVVGRFG